MAFFRTFQAGRRLEKLNKNHPDMEWNSPEFQKISSSWGINVLNDLNIEITVEGKATDKPAIFVGNHISYIDVIAMLSNHHLCFVAKKETESWPIIGGATAAIGCVFVDRGSPKSRQATADSIGEAVAVHKKSMCIFPEGTTSIQGKAWRRGVFKVAAEHGLYIQPLGFNYHPIRPSAYIDDDTLLPHMFGLIRKQKTKLTMKYFDPKLITDPETDMKAIEAEVRAWADEQLKAQGFYESSVGYI